MNITLSANDDIIAKSRKYAERHNTSLNELVRDFLKKISGEDNASNNAQEFCKLAVSKSGCSEPGFVFDRDEIHDRRRQR
ncbi:MAG: DUF6364 family protein [Thermodesulfobacteriota bacterium]|nr:DUF6364 family protein [Thermodesulfobacteriota bacterium]